MKTQRVELIPISEIRIVNPRSRNRITFQGIVANIDRVGLKKPITVHPRGLEDDGTRYDLVCGQGRLESVRSLGDTMIPAIMSEAPEDERYLMSLVENLARRKPSPIALLREVRRLKALHYSPTNIARMLGVDKSYVYDVIHLFQRGEEELIARVEAGRLPIETAVAIATGTDTDVQRALSDAYENGTLRGARLRTVQQIITKRRVTKSPGGRDHTLSSADLVRTYEQHTHQQRALVRRSTIITQRLVVLTSSLRRLLADDHFVTLLRAESLRTMPEYLASQLAANGKEPVRRCQ